MPAISFQSVSKIYPSARNGPLKALDDVSFDIRQGEFFGLLGPNGAGKTTLISILAGLVRPSSGRVTVRGYDVQADYANARRQLGVVPQELVFDPFFNVRESLRIQSGYFGVKNNDAWIGELLESLGLADKADANMRQLSGGMKRRMLVAQALVHKPPVIVLDEPTAGVDVELRQTLWQFIARLNKAGHTVLLTTHYLEEAEALCGRVAMLKSGRVVALERTSELLKAASSNVLRFKIDSQLPREFEGKARVTGRIVQLPAHDAHEIERYLGAIREAGLRVEDVEVRKADLEDVFLDVMSRHGDKPPPARAAEAGRGPLPSSAADQVTGLEVGSS
ncbi:MAG TPA: ABC transporter ATP-binding protein [Ramlibacter sp.]|nr:ABC transporter ATP-binding protein [Ramlibacter sp.]